jgi:two-component system phosphate regulon sensor histidine kinase PhoR
MKKKIFRYIALVSALSALITGMIICFVSYFQLSEVIRSELKNRADAYRVLSHKAAESSILGIRPSDMRVTMIAPEGDVLFDNTVDAAALENHANRIEIKEALVSGTGESSRLSATLGEETYYYAIRLEDGYVLRTAKTADSIFAVFAQNLPIIVTIMLAVALFCYMVSNKLSKDIVAPINGIDLEHPTAVYDELVPFVREIIAQRSQINADMNALQARHDTINAIMDNMREGAVLIDKSETLLYVNKSVSAMLDFTHSEQQQNLRTLFRDMDIITLAKETIGGKRVELLKSIDGRDYHIYGSPVSGVGAILLFVDVTQQAKAEKLRREFSANVSHELKTPLTSIAGYAELLIGGVPKEEDKTAFLQKIKGESDRLSQLVEDIMLLSGLDEGQGVMNHEKVQLGKAAFEVKELLTQKAEQNGVSINITADHVEIEANYSHMRELLFNLMDNAVKYNKPGGKVDIQIREKDGRAVLTVEDTGIGIPKAEQARIFERFYRVDKSRSKKLGGTGLGLAIVKHICMIYNAEIKLESKDAVGTKMIVLF